MANIDAATLRAEFDERGYTAVEGFLTDADIDELKWAMAGILDEMQPSQHPTSVFQTEDEQQHASDRYFLESSDKIRFFYEEGAVDKATGALTVDKRRACNKVGHALHWLHPTFKKHSFSTKIKNLMRALGYSEPAIVQSMYIFKQPRIGGSVTAHYDATFLAADPIDGSMGLWFALDDATTDNGCLWFAPGSHKAHDGGYRFVRTGPAASGDGKMLTFTGHKPDFDSLPYVAAPVNKGTVVCIHGLVWHKSQPNTSDKQRHAYTLHLMETNNTTWNKQNWLQETPNYKFPLLSDN